MSARTYQLKPRLSMPCWLENHGVAIKTAERRAAWHRDCPRSVLCSCPTHAYNQAQSRAGAAQ